jgi:hypothetical protein
LGLLGFSLVISCHDPSSEKPKGESETECLTSKLGGAKNCRMEKNSPLINANDPAVYRSKALIDFGRCSSFWILGTMPMSHEIYPKKVLAGQLSRLFPISSATPWAVSSSVRCDNSLGICVF